MESVCWGNSTVGSNPTLSAIHSGFHRMQIRIQKSRQDAGVTGPNDLCRRKAFVWVVREFYGVKLRLRWRLRLFSDGEGFCDRRLGDDVARKQGTHGELELVSGFNMFGIVECFYRGCEAAYHARRVAQTFCDTR